MATIRLAGERSTGPDSSAVFDHGAQYFTVKDDRFGRMVHQWMEIDLVREWSHGFATSDGSVYIDGLARFCGNPDMTAIPDHLAQRLDVRLDTQITKIQWRAPHWRITSADSRIFSAGSLVLTPPIPISLGLLDAGGIELPADRRAILNRIEYEPCIAVLLLLNGPADLPQPGGMWSVGDPIAWMADNYLKGVSTISGAITIHAGPGFSEDYWHSEDEFIISELVSVAGEWLGSDIVTAQVHRWRNSKPFMTYPEPCMSIENPAPLILAGDAFAGPRVEGAVLSGLAAAGTLL
jgi:predicted NAD/FAD-dependent oxidoreductase